MNIETTSIMVSVIASALAIFAIWKANKRGEPITGGLLTEALQTSTNTAQEITAIVQAGVFAAEQLKTTGRLPDNNAAFEFALRHAQKFLPDLDKGTLTTFIESSVLIANQATAAVNAARSEEFELPRFNEG